MDYNLTLFKDSVREILLMPQHNSQTSFQDASKNISLSTMTNLSFSGNESSDTNYAKKDH